VSFLTTWQWVIDVDEYARDPDLYQDLTLPEWLGSHPDAWLVVPLMQDVELLGFVVIDRAPAAHAINWEDHDLLKTAGRQAATHLAQLMAVQALVEAREFQAFSRLSAFVIHDLKNLVAQLSLVVTNAAKHKRNPAFMEDAIGTVENCVTKMNRLLAQLRKGKTQPGKAAALNLGTALREVVQQRQEQEPRPTLETSGPTLTVLADHDRLTAVLTHLIQNAQEATASDGWVRVKAWRSGALVHIEIADNGCGMDANFIRDRLFRPFDSTKGQGGMGIGAYESRDYVRELGGDIDVASQPGQGSTFLISLPGSWDGAT
jgi:putative PEP-CTERM system histidine kinase